MTRFESRNVSTALVQAPRSEIWALVSDPQTLADMTPLLATVTPGADGRGERWWTWQLEGIRGLGLEVAPSFTEAMTLHPEERMVFTHDPADGVSEFAGADGIYELSEIGPSCTRLDIDLTLHVDLPLPRLSRRAVQGVMRVSMNRTADLFAKRLYDRLGLDHAGINRTTTVGADR